MEVYPRGERKREEKKEKRRKRREEREEEIYLKLLAHWGCLEKNVCRRN